MNVYKLTAVVKKTTGTSRQRHTYIADDMIDVLRKFFKSSPSGEGEKIEEELESLISRAESRR